ncbi:MAG: CpsB/CapC family capsule biosynthesis tyrosine phosphatase [Pirellulaceae bacterium]
MNEAQAIPATGRIDLHCHLLPGIDDGCQNLEQSIECVRRWKEAGFIGSVCTPHVGPSWYRNNTPDNIARWITTLREELAEAGIEYQLWDGGEVRLAEETIEWFSYWGLPTLGPGRCVLLDWWGDYWPDFGTEACEFLLENGYQPILAHPERLGLKQDEYDRVLARLEAIGVWLQGNFNSISGGEGPTAQRRAEQLLREDRYFVLATDTHGPGGVPSRLEGLTAARAEFGAERMTLLLETRQREILEPRVSGD